MSIEEVGCAWMPVIYIDDEVVIRQSGTRVYVYHNTEYKTPLFGKGVCGWLSSGTWTFQNKIWRKDYSDKKAKTIEEIVAITKGADYNG